MCGYLGTRATMGFCCIPGKSGYMQVDLFITLKQLAVTVTVTYKIRGFSTWASNQLEFCTQDFGYMKLNTQKFKGFHKDLHQLIHTMLK